MSEIKDIQDKLGITAVKAAIAEQIKREYKEAQAKAVAMTVEEFEIYQSDLLHSFGDDTDYMVLAERLKEFLSETTD